MVWTARNVMMDIRWLEIIVRYDIILCELWRRSQPSQIRPSPTQAEKQLDNGKQNDAEVAGNGQGQ
jgi:hypothetical protein